jgi:hypothetical protein
MMWRAFIAILLLLPAGVLAQERNVTWTITLSEANQIIKKLGEAPWNEVNPLLQKLISQANTQLIPPTKSSEEKEEK